MPLTPGQQLRAYRERLGWTQEEAARALECSTNTVARRERDEVKFPGSVLSLMAILAGKANDGPAKQTS